MGRRYFRSVDDPEKAVEEYLDWCSEAGTPARATELAGWFDVSLRTLQRRLQSRATNLTAFLRAAQVRRLKELLIETELSLVDIARLAGFGTTRHLLRRIKEEFGVTTSELRRVKGRDLSS